MTERHWHAPAQGRGAAMQRSLDALYLAIPPATAGSRCGRPDRRTRGRPGDGAALFALTSGKRQRRAAVRRCNAHSMRFIWRSRPQPPVRDMAGQIAGPGGGPAMARRRASAPLFAPASGGRHWGAAVRRCNACAMELYLAIPPATAGSRCGPPDRRARGRPGDRAALFALTSGKRQRRAAVRRCAIPFIWRSRPRPPVRETPGQIAAPGGGPAMARRRVRAAIRACLWRASLRGQRGGGASFAEFPSTGQQCAKPQRRRVRACLWPAQRPYPPASLRMTKTSAPSGRVLDQSSR